MLVSLAIKNFALIDDAKLDLHNGLTIITGETGAGKSILLGALSMLLGKRADLSAVRDTEKKCVVEGVFHIGNYNLRRFFQKNDLDYEAETIVRREILPSGKSRAFINDSPIRLSVMESLGNRLIDIHSQHETLSVGDLDYQFKVIDALAKNEVRLKNYRESLQEYKTLENKRKTIEENQREAAAAYDYNSFLLKELQEAKLKEGLQETLEEQFQQLNNVEVLKENLSGALNVLQQENIGVLEALQDVKKQLSQIEKFSTDYQSLSERVGSSFLELEDVAQELERTSDNLEDDPAALELVNTQLQLLYNLQKKHHVDAVIDLLAIQEELTEKVAVVENVDEQTAAVDAEIEKAKDNLNKQASELHLQRQKAIPKFVTTVEKIVGNLGMPDAQMKINLENTEAFTTYGLDDMHWELSANKGSSFHDIKKVASGGELSRITLAIKSILATYSKLPTVIFDEIDTGISGDIAQKMGGILHDMGKSMQVVSITHLPQIAAKGDRHLKVYKAVENNKTTSNIQELSQEERILELAEMLGGKENQNSAMTHAKALLND